MSPGAGVEDKVKVGKCRERESTDQQVVSLDRCGRKSGSAPLQPVSEAKDG